MAKATRRASMGGIQNRQREVSLMNRSVGLAVRTVALVALVVGLVVPVTGAAAQSIGINPINLGTASQLLVNPSFENNLTNYVTMPGEPWVRAGDMVITHMPNIYDPYGMPYCGSYALATGGNWGGGNAFAYQQVTIPASAPQPVLDLYLVVHSSLPAKWFFFGITDTVTILISSGTPSGAPNTNFVKTVASYDTWNTQWNTWLHEGYYDMSAFRGQTIQVWLQSRIVTVPQQTTNFAIDNVGLWTQPPNNVVTGIGC